MRSRPLSRRRERLLRKWAIRKMRRTAAKAQAIYVKGRRRGGKRVRVLLAHLRKAPPA